MVSRLLWISGIVGWRMVEWGREGCVGIGKGRRGEGEGWEKERL